MAATRARVSGGVLGLVAALAASACGSSSSGSNPSSAGQAGASGAPAMNGGSGGAAGGSATGNGGTSSSAGSAGSSAGIGGSAGSGLMLGDSDTEACIAYALAECMRQEECNGFTPSETDCLRATFGCPEILLSTGTTRTAAGLKACAAAFATFSCAELNLGNLPDCATPGTRPVGASCDFGTQCATLDCSYRAGGACGLCAKVGELGDDCSVAANTECRRGLTCLADQCAPLTASNAIRGEGEDCSTPGVSCAPNLYCVAGTNVCAPSPTLGMSCATTHACQGSYCSKANQMCTAYPAPNQPCGVGDGSDFASWCAADLVCSTTMQATGVCVPPPSAGQPCYEEAVCDPSACCDSTQQPRQCVARLAPGAACEDTIYCQSGQDCLCADGTFTCMTQTCNTVHLAGEPCGTPNVICHPGFACTGGICQPRDVKKTSTCVSP